MPDSNRPSHEERSGDVQPTTILPPEHSGDVFPTPTLAERITNWAVALPWWAIILAVVAVVVLYSMFTSITYQNILRFLADDPQVSTDDLFEAVQVVGEPQMVVGRYVGETQDSVQTVVNNLLDDVIDSQLVQREGFIESEDPSAITIQTDDGRLTIPKDLIREEERTETDEGTRISVTYIERVIVTGMLTDRDDDTMTIRTQDEETVTFAKSRILDMEVVETIPCDREANPDCEDQEIVAIERQGAIYTGRLTTLSNTSVSLEYTDEDGNEQSVEIRINEADYLHIPTLTVAINAEMAEAPVQSGESVTIAFVEGTDIATALLELNSLDGVDVPLTYADGVASVTLTAYPDVDAALEATAAGEADATVYLASGDDRLAVAEWVEAHPGAGVVLPTPPRECQRDCEVTVKAVDDVVTGRVVDDSGEDITIQTTPPEYVVIDRSQILENRRMNPGVCALNNLRGCDSGIFLTLRVTVIAYIIALIIGLFVGLMRVTKNPVLYAISTLYVEVVRGIPLLVILLYSGFVVFPWLRDTTSIEFSDEWRAIIGLAFGYGAFVAEIFRAGIQSISRGQMEAARSLGMGYAQSMRYVILPQAVRVVLPPLGNDFIAMLKDSALISVLALPDILQLGRLYISRTYRAFEGYNTVAILYLLMTLFLSLLVRIVERRTRLPE